jgi:hypothetical protein
VADGRDLTRALCRLDSVAGADGYVRSRLSERVRETLTQHGIEDVAERAGAVPC